MLLVTQHCGVQYPSSAAVGAEVRAHLGRRARSQRWLAEQVGLDSAGLSRRISGRQAFSLDELDAVARALEVPLTVLLAIPVEVAS